LSRSNSVPWDSSSLCLWREITGLVELELVELVELELVVLRLGMLIGTKAVELVLLVEFDEVEVDEVGFDEVEVE